MENHSGRDHLKNVGLDGRVTLKWVREIACEYVNYLEMSQDDVHWRDFVML